MQCRFSPELIPTLPHAMMNAFPKTESGPNVAPSKSTLYLSATGPSLPLIPKPSGEVTRVGRGGYTLKTVLEQEHGWENGLYNKIQVETICS